MESSRYKSAHRLAVTTVILLSIVVGCYFAEIIYNFVFVAFFPDLGNNEDWTTGELIMSLTALMLISLKALAYIGAIVFFLMWLHRSYKNLEAFNVQGLDATPGWAVGYWFIPFINLFKPLKIVNEIYHGSDPENAEKGYGFSNTATTALTGFWWACWLLSNISGNIAAAIERAAKDVTNASILFIIISFSLGIIAGLLLIFIIREIDKRQTAAEQKLGILTPPMPPVFYQTGSSF